MDDAQTNNEPLPRLTRKQRRVLGVLLEKAFTTPEYYPLTLKALTTGCNQKSNRDPVSNYSEDDVSEAMEQLRACGAAAVVYPASGRTERYRHYMRQRVNLSEPQLAVLTELLLRGRQQMGELRSRASRMVPVESLEQLRDELSGLLELGYVQCNGPLDRRGIEVDHNLYMPTEGREMTPLAEEPDTAPPAAQTPTAPSSTAAPAAGRSASQPTAPAVSPTDNAAPAVPVELHQRLETLERAQAELQAEYRDLTSTIEELKMSLESVTSDLEQIKNSGLF